MSERIVIIGTYPIVPAMHGGQKRTEAIMQKYRSLGHEVRYISITTPDNYPRYSRYDFRITPDLRGSPSPTFTELIVCESVQHNMVLQDKIVKAILDFSPTIVQYEQGYAYAAVGERLTLPIIFSSHNVEWKMKQEIALSEGCSQEEVDEYVSRIKDLESLLLKKSKVTIVVSEADRRLYTALHASVNSIIVASNGISPLLPSRPARNYWKSFFDEHHIVKKAVFIGSAHPPNFKGFRALIDGVGFLSNADRIIVAGGVSDMIRSAIKNTDDIQLATLKNRVLLVGKLSEERLQGLIAEADAVILPILEGGGSNLKTAEALVSGRPIVATSHAFRSYEDLAQEKGVYIADTPENFQKAIRETFLLPTADCERQNVARVYWEQALKSLDKLFEEDA